MADKNEFPSALNPSDASQPASKDQSPKATKPEPTQADHPAASPAPPKDSSPEKNHSADKQEQKKAAAFNRAKILSVVYKVAHAKKAEATYDEEGYSTGELGKLERKHGFWPGAMSGKYRPGSKAKRPAGKAKRIDFDVERDGKGLVKDVEYSKDARLLKVAGMLIKRALPSMPSGGAIPNNYNSTGVPPPPKPPIPVTAPPQIKAPAVKAPVVQAPQVSRSPAAVQQR